MDTPKGQRDQLQGSQWQQRLQYTPLQQATLQFALLQQGTLQQGPL